MRTLLLCFMEQSGGLPRRASTRVLVRHCGCLVAAAAAYTGWNSDDKIAHARNYSFAQAKPRGESGFPLCIAVEKRQVTTGVLMGLSLSSKGHLGPLPGQQSQVAQQCRVHFILTRPQRIPLARYRNVYSVADVSSKTCRCISSRDARLDQPNCAQGQFGWSLLRYGRGVSLWHGGDNDVRVPVPIWNPNSGHAIHPSIHPSIRTRVLANVPRVRRVRQKLQHHGVCAARMEQQYHSLDIVLGGKVTQRTQPRVPWRAPRLDRSPLFLLLDWDGVARGCGSCSSASYHNPTQ